MEHIVSSTIGGLFVAVFSTFFGFLVGAWAARR
jgi:hypothetical protein